MKLKKIKLKEYTCAKPILNQSWYEQVYLVPEIYKEGEGKGIEALQQTLISNHYIFATQCPRP